MKYDQKQLQSWGIAVLRVVVGAVMLAHGSQKLFLYGLSGTAGFFAHIGIPAPMLSAYLATFAEFLGGLALIFGFATRWAAAVLVIDMLMAIILVHLKGGFFLPAGMEYALTMLAANVSLVLTGPGSCALDNVLGWDRTPTSSSARPSDSVRPREAA